jgi:hypothetical protein
LKEGSAYFLLLGKIRQTSRELRVRGWCLSI